MRALFITEDVPVGALGGAGRHAVVLANALIDAGHEVEFLGRARRYGGDSSDNGFKGLMHREIDLSGTGWQEHRFGAFLPFRRHHVARRIWAAARRLRLDRFDVLHYHGHVTELGAVVPSDLNFVHTVHDQGSECLRLTRFIPADCSGLVCRKTEAQACARCAAASPNTLQEWLSSAAANAHRHAAIQAFRRHQVIFVSDFLRRRFAANTGCDVSTLRAHVIHNFVNIEELGVGLRAAENTARSRSRVLLVGRVDRYKGFTEFFDQVDDSLLERFDFRLVGDGPDMPRFLARHGHRAIRRLGFLRADEVALETALADACVVPSLCEESCPTTVLEALALGRPVWALAQGGTPELVTYARPQSPLHLFGGLDSMAQDIARADIPVSSPVLDDACGVLRRMPAILNVYRNAAP